ncbi:MAG: hypothetical protein ABR588_00895 [Sphingomicrobium sp.]
MRKITSRDWLALSAPAAVLTLYALIGDLEEVLGMALIAVPFVLWLWLRQIRKHPQDTWRFRL